MYVDSQHLNDHNIEVSLSSPCCPHPQPATCLAGYYWCTAVLILSLFCSAQHGTTYSWWWDLYATYVGRPLWPPPCDLLTCTVYTNSWRWREMYSTYVRRPLWPPPCDLLTSVITTTCRHRLAQNGNCAGSRRLARKCSGVFCSAKTGPTRFERIL